MEETRNLFICSYRRKFSPDRLMIVEFLCSFSVFHPHSIGTSIEKLIIRTTKDQLGPFRSWTGQRYGGKLPCYIFRNHVFQSLQSVPNFFVDSTLKCLCSGLIFKLAVELWLGHTATGHISSLDTQNETYARKQTTRRIVLSSQPSFNRPARLLQRASRVSMFVFLFLLVAIRTNPTWPWSKPKIADHYCPLVGRESHELGR